MTCLYMVELVDDIGKQSFYGWGVAILLDSSFYIRILVGVVWRVEMYRLD